MNGRRRRKARVNPSRIWRRGARDACARTGLARCVRGARRGRDDATASERRATSRVARVGFDRAAWARKQKDRALFKRLLRASGEISHVALLEASGRISQRPTREAGHVAPRLGTRRRARRHDGVVVLARADVADARALSRAIVAIVIVFLLLPPSRPPTRDDDDAARVVRAARDAAVAPDRDRPRAVR